MLKRMKILMLAMLMTLGVTVHSTKAEAATVLGDWLKEMELEADISASVDYYNKYIWRGFRLDGDNVVQPSVTLSVGPIEGGFWGSFDTESNDALAGDEVDGWIGFSIDLGFLDEELEIVGVNGGHTWYSFPNGDTGLADGSHSREFYLGLTLDTFLSPYFTWYYDYEDESSGGADGNYFMVGGGHSFTLNEEYGITLDVGQEIGFNNEAFIAGDGGYSLTSVSVGIPLTESVTMTPVLAFSSPFGDLADNGDGAQEDELYTGISVAFAN